MLKKKKKKKDADTVLLNECCPTGSWRNSLSSSDGHNFLVYCTSYSQTGEESGRPNGDMPPCLTEIMYVIKGQLLRFHFDIEKKLEGRERLASLLRAWIIR